MRYSTLLVPLLGAICVIACAPATSRIGEFQPFSSACDKSNEGQWIGVEGYLRLPDTITPGNTVELFLYRDLTFSGKPIGATMPFGDGPNHAKRISSSFRDDDLKVYLADGTLVPFRTRVRLSGIMYYPITPQDFDCGLKNLYVEAAK